jgi:hypothetical protein
MTRANSVLSTPRITASKTNPPDQPTTRDDELGMAWWNSLSKQERAKWSAIAGNTGRPKDAWEAFRRGSVDQTPPVDPTRRRFLAVAAGASVASVGTLAIAAAMPAAAPYSAACTVDPIFAAIDMYRQADAACIAAPGGDIPDDVGDRWHNAYHAVLRTRPTTPAGLAALTTWAREKAAWLHDQASMMNGEDLCTLVATIDDAVRGMSGLKAWSPLRTDAELIELGARFELLVDQYYVARKPWAHSLVAAHAEHECDFGDDPGCLNEPEVAKAFQDSCEHLGVDEASDTLHSVYEDMEPLMKAINAAPVNSIEGLRAKALVAFYEVAPLCAGDTEFSFDDAYPFQQLFSAVAELCGLKGKIAATGYELPDIGGDDSDDEGEDA